MSEIHEHQRAPSNLPLLLSLHQRCLRAADGAELAFVIANETWHLMPYRQGSVFLLDQLGNLTLQTVSGLAHLHEETPFSLWLGRVCRITSTEFSGAEPRRLTASMIDTDLAIQWAEWWPEHAIVVPLTGKHGRRIGMAFFVRDELWIDDDLATLSLVAETWSYCTQALLRPAPAWRGQVKRYWNHPRRKQVLIGLTAAIFFPVRLSTIASAEIIPLQARTLAAPMEGVVKSFHVEPNSMVRAGDLLFSLDDTTLRNRREVAKESLAVSRSDALAAQQKAFDSLQSKSEVATFVGRVREKEAELAFIEESLTRIEVKAPLDGVFVCGDTNDWIGKPVVTGERIAQLAQPDDLGVLMWLPVGDAINLEAGASMRVYLQAAPLSSIAAELVQTSYQATLSPEGIAAYRIRGKLVPGSDARIGLRGVAKVYGAWRPMIYWVLRRPLGALRQWIGI